MRPLNRAYLRSQAGFTLTEVVISAAIGAIVLGALSSVILTTVRATGIASSRLEVSAQLRTFQFLAKDDFARSGVPNAPGCTQALPCTTQPIVLVGVQASNAAQPVVSPVQVTYTWDGSSFVDRQVGAGAATHAATDVTNFSWYVDQNGAVVIDMTIQINGFGESYALLFDPRLNP